MITTFNEQQNNKHENVKEDIKIIKCQGGQQENIDSFFLGIYLSLYDYQYKASRQRKGLTFLKNRVNKSQKQSIHKTKKKSTEV